MKEDWKFIEGTNQRYMISSLGRVQTLCKRPMILKATKQKSGYLYVMVNMNGKLKNIRIHRLVALHFIPNPNDLKEVNHIDGNKENNNVDNLEWTSRTENILHNFKVLGYSNKGKHHWSEEEKQIISEKMREYYRLHPKEKKPKPIKVIRVKKEKPRHINKCDWNDPESVKQYYKSKYIKHPRPSTRDWKNPEVMREYQKQYREKRKKTIEPPPAHFFDPPQKNSKSTCSTFL